MVVFWRPADLHGGHGNPKLAFTETVGIFAPPTIDLALAAALTKAFFAAGEDQGCSEAAEAAAIPLAVGSPWCWPMRRNQGVLDRILG